MNESQPIVLVGGYDGTISSSQIFPDQKLQPCEEINLTANSQINMITSHDNFFCYAVNPNYYIYNPHKDFVPSENTGHKANVTDISIVCKTEHAKDESKDPTKSEIEYTYIFTCSEDGSWKYKKFQSECIRIDKCLEEKRIVTTSSINSIQVKFPHIFLANERGEIDIYGIIAGNDFGYIKISELPIRSIALSKNGDRLVAACHDGNIFIIEINNSANKSDEILKVIFSFKAHDNAILKCVISPDNNFFVTTSADSTAKLWDFSTYKQKSTLKSDQKKWVWDASFTKDSKFVVTGGSDNYIRTWDVSTGENIYSRELTKCGITALTVFYIKNKENIH